MGFVLQRRCSTILLGACFATLHSNFVSASFTCPNECSGHGACNSAYGTCQCYNGFSGFDCAQRSCPAGVPWVAVATATDTARTGFVECSNAGTCDRGTGLCACDKLFEGAACDQLRCPVYDDEVCGGRGICTSMYDYAIEGKTEYTVWDAEIIYGCVCDAPYFGPDCSLKGCAIGDDPSSTLEDQECNARGHCDYTTGECACEDGYSSSTLQSDCSVKDTGTIAACPVSPSTHRRSHGGLALTGTCSGRGYCELSDTDKSTFCQCYEGWTGYACDLRACPSGRAWFDQATSANTAHAVAECSAAGICDRDTGECKCRVGFEGPACERTQCFLDDRREVCGGAGTCQTMRQLAIRAVNSAGAPDPVVYGSLPSHVAVETWDADKIQGCSCYGSSVHEHRLSEASGPVLAWTGPTCSERSCPTGDPLYSVVLLDSTPEIQRVDCESATDSSATTFALTFRGETTAAITGNATAYDIEQSLQALWTVGSVDVTLLSGASEACAVGGSSFQISFQSEFGELPTIDVSCSGDCAAASSTVATPGTKLNIECSGSGTCDRANGLCKCFEGFASSDGFAGSGLRLDCGYNLPVE